MPGTMPTIILWGILRVEKALKQSIFQSVINPRDIKKKKKQQYPEATDVILIFCIIIQSHILLLT